MEQGANICCPCGYERFHGKFSDERAFRKKEPKNFSIGERGTYVYMLTLEHHQLSPFVTKKVEAPKGKFGKDPQGALSGRRYFKKWEEENGAD